MLTGERGQPRGEAVLVSHLSVRRLWWPFLSRAAGDDRGEVPCVTQGSPCSRVREPASLPRPFFPFRQPGKSTSLPGCHVAQRGFLEKVAQSKLSSPPGLGEQVAQHSTAPKWADSITCGLARFRVGLESQRRGSRGGGGKTSSSSSSSRLFPRPLISMAASLISTAVSAALCRKMIASGG